MNARRNTFAANNFAEVMLWLPHKLGFICCVVTAHLCEAYSLLLLAHAVVASFEVAVTAIATIVVTIMRRAPLDRKAVERLLFFTLSAALHI